MEDFTIAYGKYDKDPDKYYLPDNSPLKSAVYMALKLGKPLFISGDPGTGKTQLAYWAAKHLSGQSGNNMLPFNDTPFVFQTKTSSASKDLFYRYDAVSHFRANNRPASEFINLSAMGLAICQTKGRNTLLADADFANVKNINTLNYTPCSSVLLIDEIDKAPRDFTNDLLDEIENNRFDIDELGKTVTRNEDQAARILIILTSNNENMLPEPFLRRCLFYNIPFPGDAELQNIITNRISPFLNAVAQAGNNVSFSQRYEKALQLFRLIKEQTVVKQPSTSELLDWIKVLHLENLLNSNVDITNFASLNEVQKKALKLSLYTLVKTRQDFEHVENLLSF